MSSTASELSQEHKISFGSDSESIGKSEKGALVEIEAENRVSRISCLSSVISKQRYSWPAAQQSWANHGIQGISHVVPYILEIW